VPRNASVRLLRPKPVLVILGVVLAAGCSFDVVLSSFAPREVGQGARLDRRLAELWLEALDRAPERATIVGRDKDSIYWNPSDSAARRAAATQLIESLARLTEDFPLRDLSPEDGRRVARAVRLLRREWVALTTDEPPRPHAWAGTVTTAPSFLAHLQPASDREELRRWVQRLEALAEVVESETLAVESRGGAARLPRPILEATLELLAPVASGIPHDPLLEPFEAAAARLPAATSEPLVRRARQLVREVVRPAYARFVAALEAERGRASEVSGAWRSPETEAAWLARLEEYAGPGFDPLTLHELGRAEVVRLHAELQGFTTDPGGSSAWFEELRADPALAPAYELGVRPPAELWGVLQPVLGALVARATAELPEVSRAEAWDRSKGHWSPLVPAAGDGARRAQFLVQSGANAITPPWLREFQALRYGIPGRALFDQLTAGADVPRLLAHAVEDAHAEGWSLAVTLAALEQAPGLERDGGFARFAAELVEATALVVDTGLHARRWSRAQSVDFLCEMTPLTVPAAEDLVLRIAAEPGRAAAPYLGLLKLRGLERRALQALGQQFDRAAFLRAVVDEGPLAPAELDDLVQRWIGEQTEAVTDQ
jgi:uncharacterized protein (DUF885 family)